MKNKILVSTMMLAGLLIGTSLQANLRAQVAKVKTEIATGKKYACPHHPDQVSDKPGKCGVCGMDLVEVKDMGKQSMKKKMDAMPEKMKMDGEGKKKDMDKMKKGAGDMKMEMKKDMKDMKMDSSKMMKKQM